MKKPTISFSNAGSGLSSVLPVSAAETTVKMKRKTGVNMSKKINVCYNISEDVAQNLRIYAVTSRVTASSVVNETLKNFLAKQNLSVR